MKRRQIVSGPMTALTLVELLVVVAIVAVLAAMAVPNFLEAQTRAKVARARNDMRVIAEAMEWYHVDYGVYPFGRQTPGRDPFGVFAIYALGAMTTPVAYLTAGAFADPFGPMLPVEAEAAARPGSARPDRPFPLVPDDPTFLFFNYVQFGQLQNNPSLMRQGYAVLSVGPDRRDSFGVYLPFPGELPQAAGLYGIRSVADTVYDPTNGTLSGGDIGRWGGDLPAIAARN